MMTESPPSHAEIELPDHIVLYDVGWEYYERTLVEVGRSPLRITYDDGTMEIRRTSVAHEFTKKSVDRLIGVYSIETATRMTGLGCLTCRRAELRCGLDPDECYYVRNSPPPRSAITLDLRVHAPPDLVIDVEVSRSSIPRFPIYGSLGVPEVWRCAEDQIVVLHRQPNGEYATAADSRAFPNLPMSEFNRFLTMALTVDQHDAVIAFGDWLRDRRN